VFFRSIRAPRGIAEIMSFQVEFHGFFSFVHDDLSHPVRRVDRAAVGLHEGGEHRGEGCADLPSMTTNSRYRPRVPARASPFSFRPW
jgi:hypothetical protein